MTAGSPGQPAQGWSDRLLAWYFVAVWGSGFLATKIGLQYSGPFTFVVLRYAFGLFCLALVVLALRPSWPATRRELGHLVVAGLLMHGLQLSGTHASQSYGLSAGVTALILAAQPLLTAAIASRWMRERLTPAQWTGVGVGLTGVALVVWHKFNLHDLGNAGLLGALFGLASVTIGTLYQRAFCPRANLWSGAFVQFAVSLVFVAPIAWVVEDFRVTWSWQLLAAIAFLVILSSILAVNALNTLMRRGQATRVTSLLYLPPVIAVILEFFMFGERPGGLALFGMAVTCAGVALVSMRPR